MRGKRSPAAQRRKDALNSSAFGVTATFRYGTTLRTLVATSRRAAMVAAMERWGVWDGDPCYSTPLSIYLDLTAETRRRNERVGMHDSPF